MQSSKIAGQSIISAAIGASFSSIGVVLFTFVSGVLVARILGPEARGEYGAILFISQIVAAFSTLSFFDASIVILRKNNSNIREATFTSLLVSIAFSVVAIVCSFAIILLLGKDLYVSNWWVGAAVFGAIILFGLVETAFFALERAQMRFLGVNVSRVSAPFLFSLFIVLVWFFGKGDVALEIVLLCFVVSKVPISIAWAYSYRRDVFGSFDKKLAQTALFMGFRLHVAVTITLLAGGMDRIIGIAAWSNETLGTYFVAFSAVGAGYGVITTAINTVLLPYLAGVEESQRAFQISRIIRVTILMVICAIGVGAALLPYLVPLLYGEEYVLAVDYAIALLIAMSFLPLKGIIIEASRSLGVGQPSVEIAVSSIIVLWVGYLICGYEDPFELILFLGVSNLISILVGVRHLVKNGDITRQYGLFPNRDDLRFVQGLIQRVWPLN